MWTRQCLFQDPAWSAASYERKEERKVSAQCQEHHDHDLRLYRTYGPACSILMAIFSRAKSKASERVSTRTVDADKNNDDPFRRLNENEASILRRQLETSDVAKVTWRALFRFASPQDLLLIGLSSFCAIAAGAAVPLNTVILGSLAGAFQDFTNGQSRAEFDARVRIQTLYFVYLAIGECS